MERKKVTVPAVMAMKRKGKRIAMLSVYDYPTARLADEAGVDIILVGDTLGMVILGYETTLPVTMDEMLCHVKAVSRARPAALVIADMPFMSFQVSPSEALKNAGRMIKEGGADAVKIEGGVCRASTAKAIGDAKIPVMGHIGLTPQAIRRFGGYKVQGKTGRGREAIIDDAFALEEAGCFAIVLEGVPWRLAKEITEKLSIPTIGIGAGPQCDGQVLVCHDILGLYDGYVPKFVRKYADLKPDILKALSGYVGDVRTGAFPSLDESYDDAKDNKKD
ncbi:MAG: 3-methyl-2-oxobutanoate hydroxymethyltransferase [Candidatus Eisenbacteria bacterium]